MKHLILMRHAKSSWDNSDLDDHERPLNARGVAGAAKMGEWLKNLNLKPDHGIVSDAVRAQQTWSGVLNIIGDVRATHTREMYLAGPDGMLDLIQKAPDAAQTVMLVGHQPGMSALTQLLADGSEPAMRTRAYGAFTTGATAVLDIPVETWKHVQFGAATFRRFATPKELAMT